MLSLEPNFNCLYFSVPCSSLALFSSSAAFSPSSKREDNANFSSTVGSVFHVNNAAQSIILSVYAVFNSTFDLSSMAMVPKVFIGVS